MKERQYSSSSLLLVTAEEGNDRAVGGDTTRFVVEKELSRISQSTSDTVYAELSNADVDVGLSLPLYDIAWPHILKEQRGALYQSVLVYIRLEAVCKQVKPDVVAVDDDVDREIQAVVRDFCDSYGVPAQATGGEVSKLGAVRRFVICSFFLIPFFTDQAASLVLKRLTSSPTKTDVVFVPALGRTESILPVLREATFKFETVITSMASSWVWQFRNDDFDRFNPRPISQFTSLRLIARQSRLFVSIGMNILCGDKLTSELDRTIEQELDVNLDRALEYSVQNGFRTRLFGSLFLYPLFEELLDTVDTDIVATGKLSPAGRAIVMASIANSKDVCHIPHGTGSADCPNPPEELTELTSGEFDIRYYSESQQVRTHWNCVATGRPYLTELYEEYGDPARFSPSEPYKLLLATQPFRYRDAFVRDVIRATEASSVEFEIVIKIHPSEDLSFYTSHENQFENVSVVENDLFRYLEDADLTLTVYSNVGLESIIVGTPCVIVNRWNPISPIPIYARYGPVENLRDRDQITEFLSNINPEKLSDLLNFQQDVMSDGYELKADAAKKMVKTIQPEPPDTHQFDSE